MIQTIVLSPCLLTQKKIKLTPNQAKNTFKKVQIYMYIQADTEAAGHAVKKA